ncbi:MAG: class I SAM-dependent methyltransferase [Deltaproteobacteria bacterium]|nr:class I SAM-dependent methyltransferase [Deltaproteobacteria bacterium]
MNEDRPVPAPFRKAVAGRLTSEQQELLRRAFESETDWRRRILLSPPGSKDRAELMRQMYEDIHSWSIQIDQAFGRDPYFAAVDPSEKKARSLARLCLKGRCLEVGAGGGALAWALGLDGWIVEGVDLVWGMDWTKIMEATQGRVTFHLGDFTTMNSLGGNWDLIIMDESLEHIPPGDYEMVLSKAHRLLKKEGWICVVFPNALTGPLDVSQYFLPRGAPAQAGHFNERSLKALARDLTRAGFENMVTVAYGGLPAGRRFGWSPLWYAKARLAEAFLAVLPPRLRMKGLFPFLVPSVIAARKR